MDYQHRNTFPHSDVDPDDLEPDYMDPEDYDNAASVYPSSGAGSRGYDNYALEMDQIPTNNLTEVRNARMGPAIRVQEEAESAHPRGMENGAPGLPFLNNHIEPVVADEDLPPAPSRYYLQRNRSSYWRRDLRSRRRQQQQQREGREGGGTTGITRDYLQTLTPEARQRCMDLLATIRVKRKTRKSLRLPSGGGQQEDKQSEESYDEGLPSSTALPKAKSLAERLKYMHDNTEVAKSLRENYLHFDPSLVASAAWRGWERKKAQLYNVWNHLDVWSSHFKEIEGRFGSATASYFRFARWLVFLNLYTFLMTMLVIVIPFHASPGHPKTSVNLEYNSNSSIFLQQAYKCSVTYEMTTRQFTGNESASDKALDFFVGTGWMERTSMFYGLYQNSTFGSGEDKYHYNMSLAYILTIIITFFVTFLLILANASNSVKETVLDTEEHSSVHFTNSVLCGWDFCIYNEKMANSKKSILFQEFKADLLEQSKRLQRQNRTNKQKAVLMLIRVVINIIVIGILAGTLYLVYYTTDLLINKLLKEAKDPVLLLLIQMLPSLTITILNFIIPMVFVYLVRVEDYWPAFELKITLSRTVLVRLSSLGVLIFSLYYTLLWSTEERSLITECPQENTNKSYCCGNLLWGSSKSNDTTSSGGSVQCWETYVGQQFYKLCIVDFAVLVIVTFLVDFPRKLVYDRFKDKSKIVYELCHMEFDIPRNVLDIVYSQTLSWMGMYFAPLLPAINLIKVCLIFYLKKLTLMKNYSPPQHVYKVSKSNSFFNIILLLSFVLVSITIGYMAGNISPSKSCGPFRVYSVEDYVVWRAVTDLISSWPDEAQNFFFFFGTTAFFIPCFIILSLMMYYYWAVGQGYKRMEEILQEQLRLEGKDKQFLLARVNEVIRQSHLNSQ